MFIKFSDGWINLGKALYVEFLQKGTPRNAYNGHIIEMTFLMDLKIREFFPEENYPEFMSRWLEIELALGNCQR